ncbi:autophagy-related protein 11-domain-containing protein [Xylariaceae sp. FL1272]|nr:autophagy-related protein 11-domain-containing protein [Xylariaceae sp. FL1272]
MASQTQVLIAHTGQRLQVDSSQFTTLDIFKAWVARESAIPSQNVVALTSQGKSVKIQTIQSEKEIYVYDIRITQASSPGTSTSLVSESSVPAQYQPTAAPNSIDDTHSLRSWQDLFKKRRDWALNILGDCANMVTETEARYAEIDVMLRCLDAAVANLESALKPIEPKFADLKKWATGTQEEYTSLASSWESYLELARSINISPVMVKFMTGQDIRKPRQATLEDLIDPEPTRKAGKLATTSLRKFSVRIADLDKAADKMFQGGEALFQDFDKLVGRSAMQHATDCKELFGDIEAVAERIDRDYQATLQYTNPTKDVPQVSKTAANHTKQLLPSMRDRAIEMSGMLQYAAQARNEVAADSLIFMRNIAEITSLHHSVKTQMNLISKGEEDMATFDYLRLIQNLPFMYASFTAEAIRRRDWAEKMKTDSSTLLNEVALFQDEELKRRRKWQKMVGSTYGPDKDENKPLGLEVNWIGGDEPWPAMTKQDLEDFMVVLRQQNGDAVIIADVAKLIADLNSPTKQQSKRLKAFKNGSVHEANLGRSGLLIRGDDELLRKLQEEKSRLENKLRTAESRVRRLEDIFHRQTQASRPSIFPQQNDQNDYSNSIRSPHLEDRRRSSVSENSDVLIQRITRLEADLKAEKERASALQKVADTHAEHMSEANSTKQDLMGNMEALKREFVDERKSLEDEIKQLKTRLEETEDAMEHFGDSRENEKFSYDEKMRSMQNEIDRLTRDKQDDFLKVQGQVDFLRNEARVQRERNVSLERELREARDAIKNLTKVSEAFDENNETHARSLRELHSQLSPTEVAPQDFTDLLDAVATKSTDVLSKFQSLEQDLSLMKADLEIARGTVRDIRSELSSAKEKLSKEEMANVHLRETLDREKARCSTLEAEVADGREQMNRLRIEMTEGETGSEALRNELEGEEKRVAELTEQVASKQSQVGSLEEEVRMFQEKLQATESRLEGLNGRFEDRNSRTKDLTQRLYTHNERLCRLLERLSFSVTRRDGSMVIQKIPRSERPSQNPNDSSDPGTSIRRSVSNGSNLLADSTDLKLLYWMNAEDSSAEDEQYQAFITGPGNFDIDAFAEAIYRRVKEIEHTARKMTRDARGYRERAHTSAKEAHEKIAFKHFKEGDLALFLPTRNQTTGAWAAFNVGCPHFFLREQENHRLRSREWLVARITRIQERVVDLSKSLQSTNAPPSEGESDSVNTGDDNDNPFDLSDGLRWWLIDAHEDKPGAPATPGLGKSTVASNKVEAVADMHAHGRSGKHKSKVGSSIEGVSRTLSKNLESRRSSTGSKKALPFASGTVAARGSALASETNSLRAAPAESPVVGASPTMEQSVAGPSNAQDDQQATSETDKDTRAATAETDEGRPRPDDITHSHSEQSPQRPGQPRAQRQPAPLQRDVSDTPSNKSIIWSSLWNVDVSYTGR